MKLKKILIFVIILLISSALNVVNVNSYAGYDDLIVLGVGCVVGGVLGGFWDPIWGGGQCSLWVPQENGDCGKCNENILQECSEYQCKAIGKNCVFNTKLGQCLDIRKDDTRAPRITGCEKLSKYSEYQNGQRQARYSEERCEFGEVIMGKGVVALLVTDEYAQCKYDVEFDKSYGEMRGTFDIFKEYSKNHYLVINPGEEATKEIIKKCENGGCRLLVKCADAAGNEMRTDYAFVFGIKGAGEDITPPSVEYSNVDSGFIMRQGDYALDFALIAEDESGIGGCRYSKDNDVAYTEMTNNLNCIGSSPSACSATLTGIQDGVENIFYFRCIDKKGNSNNIGYEYVINGGTALSLSIVSPSSGGKVNRGNEIVVNTQGGVDNNADCYYSWKTNIQNEEQYNEFEMFTTTGLVEHKQKLDFLEIPEGVGVNSVDYNVKIKCEDGAGDIANSLVDFTLTAEPLTITIAGAPTVNGQSVSFSVNTANGYDGDGKANCEVYQDDGNHAYTGNGIALESVDNIKHDYVGNGFNGEHKWKVVCQDIKGRSSNSLDVSFTINTPALSIGINPGPGNINALRTDVKVITSNGIDNGKAKCKYISGEGITIDKSYDYYSNPLDEDADFSKTERIFSLPSKNMNIRFTNGDNRYYFICKDMAGKTIGQLVDYVVDIKQFDLGISVGFKDVETMNPGIDITTTNGVNNGYAECSVGCSGLSSANIGIMSEPTKVSNGYVQNLRFKNVGNGQYSCKITCDDDLSSEERTLFSKDVALTVDTTPLEMEVKWPKNGENIPVGSMNLIIETFNGVNNNGEADCFYTDHLVDGFKVGEVIDITKKSGISMRDWADKVCSYSSCKEDIGNGYKYTQSIGNIGKGSKTLYVQCKDKAKKLAPEDGPVKIDFIVS